MASLASDALTPSWSVNLNLFSPRVRYCNPRGVFLDAGVERMKEKKTRKTDSWSASRLEFLERRESVWRVRNSARRMASLISLREVSSPKMGGAGTSSISRSLAMDAV